MKYILNALLIAMVVATSACSKPLPSDKQNYIGRWISADNRIELKITANGRIEYTNNQSTRKAAVSAPIKNFTQDTVEAGLGPIGTHFSVKQPPSQDDKGNWYMVFNDNKLVKTVTNY